MTVEEQAGNPDIAERIGESSRVVTDVQAKRATMMPGLLGPLRTSDLAPRDLPNDHSGDLNFAFTRANAFPLYGVPHVLQPTDAQADPEPHRR